MLLSKELVTEALRVFACAFPAVLSGGLTMGLAVDVDFDPPNASPLIERA
jgi:hypothetical protein